MSARELLYDGYQTTAGVSFQGGVMFGPETSLQRVASIDAFRGLTMGLMLLVDVCGDSVPCLSHSKWNGISLADFVMPAFLFLMGASLGISVRRRPGGLNSDGFLRQAQKRALKLFFIGLALQGQWIPSLDGIKTEVGFDIEGVRIMGILQRIAVCYLVMVYLIRVANPLKEGLIVFLALLVQFSSTCLLPVPKCPHGSDFSIECNGESYIDRIILGPRHLYKPDLGYEPEGIASTLGCIFPCILGFWTLQSKMQPLRTRLSLSGALVVAGSFFALLGIPPNKALWTLSYNLATTGSVLLVFSVMDRLEYSQERNPLVHLGSNALLFFMLSDCGGLLTAFLNSFWILRDGVRITMVSWFKNSVLQINDMPNMILVYALLQIFVFCCFFRYLHNNGIFIKI
jgi:heparan-alpha-glucosaminide N-acetyltransferase